MTGERKLQAETDLKIILEALRRYRVRYGFKIVTASSAELEQHGSRRIVASGAADYPEIQLDLWEDNKNDI